jgi:hypothetical protein
MIGKLAEGAFVSQAKARCNLFGARGRVQMNDIVVIVVIVSMNAAGLGESNEANTDSP